MFAMEHGPPSRLYGCADQLAAVRRRIRAVVVLEPGPQPSAWGTTDSVALQWTRQSVLEFR